MPEAFLQQLGAWALGLAVVVAVSVGGIALAGFFIVRLPSDYFLAEEGIRQPTPGFNIRTWFQLALRNTLGGGFVLLGLVLVLPGVPGPGLVVVLLGVALLQFRGKRRIERWIVGLPGVLRVLNDLRVKRGRRPFDLE